jgi:predicted AlkP superfamily pyrophosphatase or phosphodiesterase
LTGKSVAGHGVVANGWYSRELAEHQFWKQSNHLVGGAKLWEVLKETDPNFTCAKVFWWYNMYSSADFSVTPRPIYPSDGRKVFDVYTNPMGMREEIKEDLGPFPFPSFWGPNSGIESTQWIAKSAKWIERKNSPSLSLVYLPHLDYCLQKFGPDHPEVAKELRAIDCVFKDLLDFYESRDVKVIVLSEYGITSVNNPVHLNRIFRSKGWLTIKDELGKEMIDLGASKAFAIADHQVAHIYVNDLSLHDDVLEVVRSTEGVGKVISGAELDQLDLKHDRAGDMIAVSDERSWFTYYFWEDDQLAPDYARCVDIHRKPGYDPVELFFDPEIKFKFLKVAMKLLRKKLGFRYLMDLIPLKAEMVGGSHGRIPENKEDWPILIGDFDEKLSEEEFIEASDVFHLLVQHCQAKALSDTQ